MFFYLSKILWFILEPANFFFLLLVIGVVFLWTRWRKFGAFICTLTCLLYGAIGFLPIGAFLIDVLESRFDAPEQIVPNVKGVIVLGGVIRIDETLHRGHLIFTDARERVDVLKKLSKIYPDIPIVFTSGSNSILDQSKKEADILKPYLEGITHNPERLIFENQSRNTIENAVFSKKIVNPKKDERWLLVTSAAHMPRSVGVFRKQGWSVIPNPVAYVVPSRFKYDLSWKLRQGHVAFARALHEWLGLLAYYMTGKTSALLPAP